MPILFITRHPGARDWLARCGHAVDRISDELTDTDLAALAPGDTVIGTLPVALAAAVCARGARYLNLVIPAVPRELRGQELDADTLTRLGARIEAFEVHAVVAPLAAAPVAVHVGIVSAEPLGNLIPALIDRPARFVALASQTAERNGQHERLRAALAQEGIACEVRSLPEDGPGLRAYAAALAAEFADTAVALNATGGTKPMSMALTDAFRRHGLPAFYCDTQRRVRLDLSSGAETPLAPVLAIHTALAAQGATVKAVESAAAGWQAAAQARAVLADWLAMHFVELEPLFDAFDRMGKRALDDREEELRDAVQPFPDGLLRPGLSARMREALGRMAVAGLIEQRTGNSGLKYRSVEAARWLRGRWFETWAWNVARAAAPQQLAAGVQLHWHGEAKRQPGANELDLVLLHANRMLVAECKTGRFGGEADEREQDVLNTLDSLARHAAGVLGKRIVLSARTLGPAAHDRAQRYGIVLLDGVRVQEFGEQVRRWVSGN